MDDYTRKRLLAIEVLLEEPEEINDILETELHALRDRLHTIALSSRSCTGGASVTTWHIPWRGASFYPGFGVKRSILNL